MLRLVLLLVLATTTAAAATRRDPVIERLRKAIVEERLTTLDPDCYAISSESRVGKYVDYNVREVHNLACGGEIDTSPLMFSMRAQPKTGRVWFQEPPSDRFLESPPAYRYSCAGRLTLFQGPPSQKLWIKPDNQDESADPFRWSELDARIRYWAGCERDDESPDDSLSERITEGISACRLWPGVDSELRCYRAFK